MTIPVCLVDVGCGLGDAYLRNLAAALAACTSGDFARGAPYGYGASAACRVAARVTDLAPHEWLMGFWPSPDVPDALGYHDVTPGGQPVMHVFPLLDAPEMASVTASHELFEALADPDCDTAVVGPDGRVRCREPGDPVEATYYPYRPPGGQVVLVSNWVTPAYFDGTEGVPLDHLGLVHAPGEILPGGYAIYWDGAQWTSETNGKLRPYRQRLLDLQKGRSSKRKCAPSPVGALLSKSP